MKLINKEEFLELYNKHQEWLKDNLKGSRLVWNFSINFKFSFDFNLNLHSADLRYADLRSADLRSANLRSADLSSADLRSADLRYADLRYADLRYADLRSADLSSADLRSADLDKEKQIEYRQRFSIVADGDIIGWKKISRCLIKLLIPEQAKRVNALSSRKCRAEFADVLSITEISSGKEVAIVKGGHDLNFFYIKDARIFPDKYNDSCLEECTNGIHFFITKLEAEEY